VRMSRIEELSALMDLDLSKKIEDLSYGNKKKVGIVQGLLHEPKLIILDEPTSGLDPLMQKKFFNLIETENKKGSTVLFSSHILPEVQKLCTRVGIIKDGKIIKIEDMNTLRNETYKNFTVETVAAMDPDLFRLEGITRLEQNGFSARFLYRGDINLILERLHGVPLKNMLVEEPTLEEIFMHYYQKGE